jgi:hypothetical protein
MRTALLLALLSCAPARKQYGEIAVSALRELYPQTLVVHESVFRIESARIVGAGAVGGSRFDLVVTEDACLRGTVGQRNDVYFCPAPPEKGDPKGLYRWRNVGGGVGSFAVRLLHFGDVLHLEANLYAADLPLPQGPAGDELRRHPELLGAAFAFGFFPSAAGSKGLWNYRVVTR